MLTSPSWHALDISLPTPVAQKPRRIPLKIMYQRGRGIKRIKTGRYNRGR